MRFFERVAQLENERVPFALATVVSRNAPVSSHMGDRAVVFADGNMEGFVGGSCSRDIVRRHCVEAIRSGTPRLLHIRPEPAPPDRAQQNGGEHVFIPMSCASEGAVDVYVEPHLPARRLIVAGFTPVAQALAHVAAALAYDVLHAVGDDEMGDLGAPAEPIVTLDTLRDILRELTANERARTVAVVASLGRYDEAALDALLGANLAFVGLVASRKRAARVFGVLAQQGCAAERIATVRSPVGLDIGARTPGDVAISILAEIVASSPQVGALATDEVEGAASQMLALDPICGMDVEIDGALHRFELDGRTYYFCGAGCRAAFASDPARALASLGNP